MHATKNKTQPLVLLKLPSILTWIILEPKFINMNIVEHFSKEEFVHKTGLFSLCWSFLYSHNFYYCMINHWYNGKNVMSIAVRASRLYFKLKEPWLFSRPSYFSWLVYRLKIRAKGSTSCNWQKQTFWNAYRLNEKQVKISATEAFRILRALN